MTTLKGKVLLITGASRGIGLAIALRAARDGAKVAILAKTTEEHPRLPGTIYTAADKIREAGGEAISVQCDVRDEAQVQAAIATTVSAFGGIDIVVNNAGAIRLTDTEHTAMKDFDLMHQVNARAVYLVVKHALPYLKQSDNAHVLNLSPPLNLDAGWLAPHVAYTLSKYGMSLCTLGMAEEFNRFGIAVNSLWPETAIDTAAIRNLLGGEESANRARRPEIMADAAYWIFTQPAADVTGRFYLDTAVLKNAGATDADLAAYAVDPSKCNQLLPDFFLGSPGKLSMGKSGSGAHSTPPSSASPVAKNGDAVPIGKASAVPFVLTAGKENGIARLKLTNPAQRNCLGQKFFDELPKIVADLTQQKTRVLIVEAEGSVFCSGIDLAILNELAGGKAATDKKALKQLILAYQTGMRALMQAPFVIVAAVRGACLGAGLDLIAACDLRYCDASARFTIEEINVGIMADLGSLQRLPDIMNHALLAEMAYSGRSINAAEALVSGLVSKVVSVDQLDEQVSSVARVIAGKSPSAVAGTKQALSFNRGHSVVEAMDNAADLQAELLDLNAMQALLKVRQAR